MRSAVLIGICVAASSGRCAAQADLARIRNAIHLPHMSVQIRIEYSSSGTTAAGANPAQSTSAIANYRKLLQKNPHDGWTMSQLGLGLCSAKAADEGEKLVRQAVREAPNDWRCWANLGDCILSGSLARILDSNWVEAAAYTDMTYAQSLLEKLAGKQGLDRAVVAFAASQKEARDAYDKAVMLAPSVSGPYEKRFSFRYIDYLLVQNILRLAHGEEPVYSITLPDPALNDVWRAAELSPGDPRLQYNSLILDIRGHADKLAGEHPNDLRTALGKLPQDSRERVSNGLARLSKCADATDRNRPISSFVDLASVYFLLSDIDDASAAAKRAIELDANNQQAARVLVAAYLAGKRFSELATVLQDEIKHQDTPYLRLCLAHVYQVLGNYQAVSEQVLTGLDKFPDDLLLNLALVDGLMKAKTAGSLTKAGEAISRSQTLFDKLPEKEQTVDRANFEVTRGIYLALVGKPDIARLALRRVLNDDPNNEEAKEALDALSPQ